MVKIPNTSSAMNSLSAHHLIAFLVLFISFKSYSQGKGLQIPLWENGAPGFEERKDEPEQAKDWWVKNIHNPSITVYFPPTEIANGTAVIICPGGGHRELVFNAEGRDAAVFLNKLGVTAIVLKYRLAREENSPYKLDVHPKQDASRAMRLVRSKAQDWDLNSDKIGMLGFSAGGEVVAMVAYESGEGDPDAEDPIDRLNGRPDFQMLVYPGPLGIPDAVPAGSPPAFLLAANDDECCVAPALDLMQKYTVAKIPVEAHFYASGGHGFNMGYRSDLKTIQAWPGRLADWLSDYIINE